MTNHWSDMVHTDVALARRTDRIATRTCAEAKKIAGMAEAWYGQIAPHLYCGPIVGAANIQLATCSPNFLILESIERWDGFHADILETPVQWEDGYVIPSREPGLGVVLDEDVARAHPWTGTELQQEVGRDPIR